MGKSKDKKKKQKQKAHLEDFLNSFEEKYGCPIADFMKSAEENHERLTKKEEELFGLELNLNKIRDELDYKKKSFDSYVVDMDNSISEERIKLFEQSKDLDRREANFEKDVSCREKEVSKKFAKVESESGRVKKLEKRLQKAKDDKIEMARDFREKISVLVEEKKDLKEKVEELEKELEELKSLPAEGEQQKEGAVV